MRRSRPQRGPQGRSEYRQPAEKRLRAGSISPVQGYVAVSPSVVGQAFALQGVLHPVDHPEEQIDLVTERPVSGAPAPRLSRWCTRFAAERSASTMSPASARRRCSDRTRATRPRCLHRGRGSVRWTANPQRNDEATQPDHTPVGGVRMSAGRRAQSVTLVDLVHPVPRTANERHGRCRFEIRVQ